THLQNTIQDGRATDTWTRSEFDGYGVMSGVSALGRERALFQVAVANFNSPNLLEAENGTNFTMTRAAGTMTLNTVTNRVGQPSFVAGAVEASNVDLGEEFTKMITTQKAYNTASQVFKTSDEMLKTATQMK
ncbi:MAG: flagellar hook-basal body complex protein, partial [Rhodospirillales bacterium]|nr:flagellar hook-basal body complex protein [Rhodospirillales bacterium]